MANPGVNASLCTFGEQGIPAVAADHWNFGSPRLLELAVQRHEVVSTSPCGQRASTASGKGLSTFLPRRKSLSRNPVPEPARNPQMPIRIVAQRAWHGLFARQFFIRPKREALHDHNPSFTVIFLPDFQPPSQELVRPGRLRHGVISITGTEAHFGRCRAWSSKPVGAADARAGGFDPHELPPVNCSDRKSVV